VDVRIDEPGKDEHPRRVDHLGPRRCGQGATDPRDRLVFTPQVSAVPRIGGHYFAVLNQ
jgi:hypothetical protein